MNSKSIHSSDGSTHISKDEAYVSKANRIYEVRIYDGKGKLKRTVTHKTLRKRADEELKSGKHWSTQRPK